MGLCVCLSVKSHLTYGASVRPEIDVTYSAGNEGGNICGVFSETAPLQRSGTSCIVCLCAVGHFPAESAHTHCSIYHVVDRSGHFFFPYTFQLLKRGRVQRKTCMCSRAPRIVYACKEISACAFFDKVNIIMLHIPKPTSLGFCTLVHSYYAACMLTQ